MREFNDDLRGRRRSRASWKALAGEQAMRIRELEAAEARGRWRELKKDNLVTRLDGQLRESERRRRAMERQSEQRFLTPEELAETVVAKLHPKVRAQLGRVLQEQGGSGKGSETDT